MFYPAMAAVPEWAPARENHILYSEGILKNVSYAPGKIQYDAISRDGTEYIKIAFKPTKIMLNGATIPLSSDNRKSGYLIKDLGDGDYSLTIKRVKAGTVIIFGYQ
jgi:hypothetical protein